MTRDSYCRSDCCPECEASVSGEVADVQHGVAEKQCENGKCAHKSKLKRGFQKS